MPALFVRLAALLTVSLGLIVLAGWTLNRPLLKSTLPGAVEMKANTAMALVWGGCALFILGGRPSLWLERLAQILALAVGLLGVATLGEYLFGWQLGIDELLFLDNANAYNVIRGRMSPYSAVAFAGIGLALMILPKANLRSLVRWPAILMVLIGAVSFLGYLWNANELVTDRWLPPVAVNTAIAFIFLGGGTLLASHRLTTRRVREPIALSTMELRILAGFVGSMVLLLIGGGFTYRATAELSDSTRWVSHSQIVRAALWRAYATISDAESAQRDYLITGAPQLLERYAELAVDLAKQEDEIARLIQDNSAQTDNLAKFRRLAGRRFDLLSYGIDLYKREGFSAARAYVASGQGGSVMQEIAALAERMNAIEESLVVQREAALTGKRHRTLVSLLITLIGATGVFVFLFRSIRRETVARSKAEQSLARQSAETAAANRFLDSVIENIPNMIFIKNAEDLRFVRFNRAGEELIGYSREELLGRNDYDFFPKEEADFFISKDRKVMECGKVEDIPEEPIQTRKKGLRLLHTKKIPIADEHGRPRYLLGISEDVTEQREKEREILRLNATLERRAVEIEAVNNELQSFSYSVSHDLRAPLRHINGYVEMLAAETGDQLAEEPRRYLKVITDASRQMGQLIDDLLEFSRMGRVEMHETGVDLGSLARQTIASLETETRERNIIWDIPPLTRVQGDPAMLRLVLANLLGNAVKYSRGRDPARIEMGTAGEKDGRVVLYVRDNGAGFDMKYADKLFGVFQRLHRQDEFEGTGVGLANVQRIVARHGGRVWAEAAPDKGATFYFTLKPAP